MSRWHGLGGEWIDIGLPMHIAIDRKLENGCEIQDAACGKSGIVIWLILVKTATEQAANSIHEDEDGMLHGTKVLAELVSSWAHADRIVCGDSRFASVGAAEALKALGLCFVGVVKTATKRFPLGHLSNLELENRGGRHRLVVKGDDGEPKLLAFAWMDRGRRCFIASGSSLVEGEHCVQDRWRQVDQEENADPERVESTVPQPKAAEVCCSACQSVDQHNRLRQATLKTETKIQTKQWDKRVDVSIFAMCVVDTWLAWSLGTASKCKQSDLHADLAEEMADDTHDEVGGGGARRGLGGEATATSPSLHNGTTGEPRAGPFAHLTATKQKRRKKDGTLTDNSKQGCCIRCKRKTKFNCSQC